MGIKAAKTNRLLVKYEEPLLVELFKLNRFSKHIQSQALTTEDKIQLQAVCISELGRVVQEETNTPPDKVIKGMELAFERTRNKWNGQNSMYFLNRIENSGRVTSYNLANVLKRVSNRQFGIEKRIVKNHWHYMSNGYKEILKKGLIWS